MKKAIFILVALVLLCIFKVDLAAAKERSLVYHSYASEGEGEAVISETFVKFKDLSGDQTFLSRRKQNKDCMMNDEFILDRDYSLESWRRVCPGEDTDLLSVREGDVLVVKGRLKGKVIDKKIKLGNKDLHMYSKYSLTKFVLSDMPKMKFWTLRRDQMSKIPMKAVKKGTKIIVVNGKEVEAIKVYCSITGKLREKHYNFNYYYRKSDGLLIKKEWPSGKIEELVSEE